MGFDLEVGRGEPGDARITFFDFEYQSAGAAVEVMVVLLARQLESIRLTGELYGGEPSLFRPRSNRTIDGRDPKPGAIPLSSVQYFLRRERPRCLREYASDRAFLTRAAAADFLIGRRAHLAIDTSLSVRSANKFSKSRR